MALLDPLLFAAADDFPRLIGIASPHQHADLQDFRKAGLMHSVQLAGNSLPSYGCSHDLRFIGIVERIDCHWIVDVHFVHLYLHFN